MGQTFLFLALLQLFIVALTVLRVQRSKASQTAAPVCVCDTGLQKNSTASNYVQRAPPSPPPKRFSFQPLVLRPWKNSDSSTFQVLWFVVSETVSCGGDKSEAYFSTGFDLHSCFAYSHLCSRSVAWISQTLTKERRFLSSVQFSDKQMLPIVWASSRSLDACDICTLQK